MSAVAISAEGLTKSYARGARGVADLSFDVQRGEVIAAGVALLAFERRDIGV